MSAAVSMRGMTVASVVGGAEIISDIDLDLAGGEIFGLVGESGSGKSTLALAFLWHTHKGLTRTRGSVTLAGAALADLEPSALRRLRGRTMAYVPQDPSRALNPAIPIGAQMRHVIAQAYPNDAAIEARLKDLLIEVELPQGWEFLRRYPHQLSGGQQQRVVIAMAFACRPAFVALDEPTTGLDVTVQKRILATVKALCREFGTAALYVTHDLAVVAAIADRVGVLYSGRIVEVGPTQRVLADPLHPYTRKLLGAVPTAIPGQVLTGIRGRAPLPGLRPAGCAFHPRCDLADSRCATVLPVTSARESEHSVRCWHAGSAPPDLSAAQRWSHRLAASADRAGGLRVTDLTAYYGPVAATRGVSFDLSGGEILALVGESGSGKTTVSRCIVGAQAAYAGSVSVDGHELHKDARRRTPLQRRALQYVFQNPYGALNPRRTIGQTLEQWAKVLCIDSREERVQRIALALDRVGLEHHHLGRYPNELSGGQQQRVAIARALVSDPSFLICDEITSALDVSVQASVVNLLVDLCRDTGLGVLFITHNLPLVGSVADRVVVMRSGLVVECENTSQLFDRPKQDYTRRLLADSPSLATNPV